MLNKGDKVKIVSSDGVHSFQEGEVVSYVGPITGDDETDWGEFMSDDGITQVLSSDHYKNALVVV